MFRQLFQHWHRACARRRSVRTQQHLRTQRNALQNELRRLDRILGHAEAERGRLAQELAAARQGASATRVRDLERQAQLWRQDEHTLNARARLLHKRVQLLSALLRLREDMPAGELPPDLAAPASAARLQQVLLLAGEAAEARENQLDDLLELLDELRARQADPQPGVGTSAAALAPPAGADSAPALGPDPTWSARA